MYGNFSTTILWSHLCMGGLKHLYDRKTIRKWKRRLDPG